jgi:hypothetical protein
MGNNAKIGKNKNTQSISHEIFPKNQKLALICSFSPFILPTP